jgi:enoyl-[acyl-carrier-protein] reductase (NADH)
MYLHDISVYLTMSGITFESLVKDVVKSQPVKRIGHINDVAYACLYLASDESAYVTGSPLYVDGGLLACRT